MKKYIHCYKCYLTMSDKLGITEDTYSFKFGTIIFYRSRSKSRTNNHLRKKIEKEARSDSMTCFSRFGEAEVGE